MRLEFPDSSSRDLDLSRRLRAVALKRPGFAVALWGEAGIGKTHTVRQTLQSAPCKSYSFHATSPLSDWIQGLPRPAKLPVWCEGLLERLARQEHLEEGKVVDALGALLAALAPVVLCLEDLHEASPERSELVQSLAQIEKRSKGVGLLVTSRTEPPEPLQSLRLGGLSSGESKGVLEAELGASLPPEALDWIYRRAAGNPLFTLEFARFLARQGFLWNDGRLWRWRAPGREMLPITVEALVEQMLSNAAPTQTLTDVLGAKAVLPRDSSLELWAKVAGLSEGELEEARAELSRRGVINRGEFAHPLFREVAARSLSDEHRRGFARRALAALKDNPIAAAGYVKEAGLEPAEALALLKGAAEAAYAADYPAQAGHFLALASALGPAPERAGLALKAATVLINFDQAKAFELIEVAANELHHDPALVGLIGQFLSQQGRLSELEATLARLLIPVPGGAEWIAKLVGFRFSAGDHQGAAELWLSHPALHADAPASTCYAAASALTSTGNFGIAEAVINQGLSLPEVTAKEKGSLYQAKAVLYYRKGDFPLAERFFSEAVGFSRATQQLRRLAAGLFNRALVLRELGRTGEMLLDLEESVGLYRQIGEHRSVAHGQILLAEHLLGGAQYERAEAVLLEALEILRLHDNFSYITDCEANLCKLYRLWKPPLGAVLAVKHAENALRHARASKNPRLMVEALEEVSLSYTAAGRGAEGLQKIEEAITLSQGQDTDYITRITLLYAKGMALAGLGHSGQALETLAAAETLALDTSLSFYIHQIGLELDHLRGDRESAGKRLEWFEQRGLKSAANLARRYFPQLDTRALAPASTGLNQKLPRLEMLGTPLLDGIPIRGRKRQGLLGLLLEARISGRTEVPRLALLDTLYPGEDETRVGSALKEMVRALRESFGTGFITTTSGGYALGAVKSDAEEFLRDGDTALWRGTFLGGSTPDLPSETGESLYLALQHRAEALLTKDPAEAARLAEILLGADPYSPEYLRLGLQAFRESGQAKSVERVYKAARARFSEVGESLPENPSAFLETTQT